MCGTIGLVYCLPFFKLQCNHTDRESIMGSWVNNGYFRIQLTKENTLHQLPGAGCLSTVHTGRNHTAPHGGCWKQQHLTATSRCTTNHGPTPLWCRCRSHAKPPCSVRERRTLGTHWMASHSHHAVFVPSVWLTFHEFIGNLLLLGDLAPSETVTVQRSYYCFLLCSCSDRIHGSRNVRVSVQEPLDFQ